MTSIAVVEPADGALCNKSIKARHVIERGDGIGDRLAVVKCEPVRGNAMAPARGVAAAQAGKGAAPLSMVGSCVPLPTMKSAWRGRTPRATDAGLAPAAIPYRLAVVMPLKVSFCMPCVVWAI